MAFANNSNKKLNIEKELSANCFWSSRHFEFKGWHFSTGLVNIKFAIMYIPVICQIESCLKYCIYYVYCKCTLYQEVSSNWKIVNIFVPSKYAKSIVLKQMF